jgi:hypothetical protein
MIIAQVVLTTLEALVFGIVEEADGPSALVMLDGLFRRSR